jgi:general secretion pathway protein C
MQNIKYHLVNILSVVLFSYICASTINEIIKYSIAPVPDTKNIKTSRAIEKKIKKRFEQYNVILESGFFKLADSSTGTETGLQESVVSSLDSLELMGTITGPRSIARAMIKKRGEKNPEIFKLYTDVYGYKLVSIRNTRVFLKSGEERVMLDLFAKKKINSGSSAKSGFDTGKRIKRSLSRSEIKQKVLNNLDNAMRGLLAGPYRKGGKIVGFQLKKVKPYNILYKMGARSGDVVKRINGHAIDSTQKLYKLWDSLKTESKIVVDLERRGTLMTFDLVISD